MTNPNGKRPVISPTHGTLSEKELLYESAPGNTSSVACNAKKSPAETGRSSQGYGIRLFRRGLLQGLLCCFHAVSAVLAHHGLAFSSHAQTLAAFNREFVKTKVFPTDTFRKLQRLFEDRQIADYDWTRDVDKQTAQKDLDDAQWLVDASCEYPEKTVGHSLRDNC